MIYLKRPHVIIYWDDAIRTVGAEWLSYAEKDDFREALDTGYKLFIQKKSSRWLADTRYMGPMAREDQEWLNNDWFPRMVKAGMRRMAVMVPHKVVTQMTVRRVLSKVGHKEFTLAYFDDLEDARNWLGSKG